MYRLVIVSLAAFVLAACNPADRRPGLWLTGEVADVPGDWSFTDAHKEIAVEVSTPYLIAHSVTIWCASLDGELYVGARAPETKNWPGWVDDDPNVRLGIDGKIYQVKLEPIDDDAALLGRLLPVYAQKYQLPTGPAPADGPRSRYWHVVARS